MPAESLHTESTRLSKCFWKCLQHCCKCLEELLGVCGESRRSPGICFGVCGSPASLPAFALAFAGVPQVSRHLLWRLRGVPQVSRHLLWRLRGVPQVLRRTCWPLQHAINDILNKGISFFCRTHVIAQSPLQASADCIIQSTRKRERHCENKFHSAFSITA